MFVSKRKRIIMLSALFMIFLFAVPYQDFQADTGGSDYGTEFDDMLTKKFGNYTVQAVYANYNADKYKTDTEKFWLQVTIAF